MNQRIDRDCPDGELLVALVEGRLDSARLAAVEPHLAECALCHQVVATALRAEPANESLASAETLTPAGSVPARDDAEELGRVGGRYVLLEQLGRGGMGTVYVAWDRELARRVALKILHPGVDHDRFQREAQALARLKHPGVVTVYDVGRDGIDVFITMELIEGQSLRRWLEAAPVRWERVLAVFVAAGRGLAAAHGAGLVHRDFKPENVLVGNDGSVRVVDFGLARSIDEQVAAASLPLSLTSSSERITRTGDVLGTPRYMAPEQRLGKAADPRADQFSFCLSVWEALFGEHPVLGARHGAPALGRVPASVRAALRRGLSTDPEARFPSMEPLLSALDRRSSARNGLLVLAGAAALTAGVALWPRDESGERACAVAAAEVGATWGDAQREAVRQAFLATGQLGAAQAAQSTVAVLDGRASALAAMAGEACRATRVRHVQSEHVHELRATCIAGRQRGLRALAQELTVADAALVQRAEQAARSLPDEAACADVDALSAPMQVPSDPTRRQPVAAVRATLSEIEAMSLAGRPWPAIVRAGAALPMAQATGFAPLVAEALLALGRAQVEADRPPEEVFEKAALAAQAAGHDLVLADAATALAGAIFTNDVRAADAERWMRLADATLARAGQGRDIDLRRAELARTRAMAATRARKTVLAEELAREAVAIWKRYQPESPQAFAAANALVRALLQRHKVAEADVAARENLALGRRIGLGPSSLAEMHDLVSLALTDLFRWDEAVYHNRRGVELARISFRDGKLEGKLENNFAILLIKSGRRAEALPAFTRAIQIYELRYGPTSPRVAALLANQGNLFDELGRHDEARRALERARDIVEAEQGREDFRLIKILSNLARTIADQDQFAEAQAVAARAVALAERRGIRDDDFITAHHADAYAHGNDPAAALPRYRQLLAMHEEILGPGHFSSGGLWIEAAVAAAGTGDRRWAWQAMDKAERIDRPNDWSPGARLLFGQLELELGDPARAAKILEDARARLEKSGDARKATKAAHLATIAVTRGRSRP